MFKKKFLYLSRHLIIYTTYKFKNILTKPIIKHRKTNNFTNQCKRKPITNLIIDICIYCDKILSVNSDYWLVKYIGFAVILLDYLIGFNLLRN